MTSIWVPGVSAAQNARKLPHPAERLEVGFLADRMPGRPRMNRRQVSRAQKVAVTEDGKADLPGADACHFERRIGELPGIVAFTAEVFERRGIDRGLLPAVDFAMEEVFTNMVKYGAGSSAPIWIEIKAVADGVEVTLADRDVPPFDVTQAPDADVTLPLEQRVPGGLGLHLTRRLVDAIEYTYVPERRESRITFRKTSADRVTAATGKGTERC